MLASFYKILDIHPETQDVTFSLIMFSLRHLVYQNFEMLVYIGFFLGVSIYFLNLVMTKE